MFATLTLYGDSMLVLYLQLFVLPLGAKKIDTKEQSQNQAVLDWKTVYIAQGVEGTVSQEVPSAKLIFLWSLSRLIWPLVAAFPDLSSELD